MRLFGYIKILPLQVLVALMSFAVRVGDFTTSLSNMGTVYAAESAESEEESTADTTGMTENTNDQQDTAESGDIPAPAALPEDDGEWRDAGESEFEYSEVRENLYKDLVARREQLQEKEKELARKQALLVAAEQELDQKLRELTALRNEIQGLLKQQSEEEQARIKSLVKIYEGMKAKDAASIFNTLDMDVLIDIMGRMSERKSAPILAEMNPERARNVTILLAEQKKLPSFPDSLN